MVCVAVLEAGDVLTTGGLGGCVLWICPELGGTLIGGFACCTGGAGGAASTGGA